MCNNWIVSLHKRMNQQTCINPEMMDVVELKQALVTRGRSSSGARQTLINRYLSSDPRTYSAELVLRYVCSLK